MLTPQLENQRSKYMVQDSLGSDEDDYHVTKQHEDLQQLLIEMYADGFETTKGVMFCFYTLGKKDLNGECFGDIFFALLLPSPEMKVIFESYF